MLFLFLAHCFTAHYLTFDVYGTLLNTSTIPETIRQIAIENQIDPIEAANMFESYQDLVIYGEGYADFDEKLRKALMWTDIFMNANVFEKSFDKLLNTYYNLKPFPEVINTLKEMKRRNYILVIMSNSVKSIMNINQHALEDLFDVVLLAQDSKAYKPNLQFFKYVHEKLDFDHNNHTHIAQGYWSDIMPANQMNWTNKIWVNREHSKFSSKYPCNMVYNLTETLQYLPELTDGAGTPFVKSWKMIVVCVAAVILIVSIIVVVIIVRKKKKDEDMISVTSLLMTQ